VRAGGLRGAVAASVGVAGRGRGFAGAPRDGRRAADPV